jgi:PadR family transcriptional regulator, regulatory protein AphA
VIDAKILCLGVVSRRPASGYQIRKEFDEGGFRYFFDAGFGSIYPALKQLKASGLIAESETAEGDRADKKVYTITPAGRTALFQALRQMPAEDKLRSEFMFVMAFAHLLPPEYLDRVIEDRLGTFRRILDWMNGCEAEDLKSGERFVLNLGRTVYAAEIKYLEDHRRELVEADGGRRLEAAE